MHKLLVQRLAGSGRPLCWGGGGGGRGISVVVFVDCCLCRRLWRQQGSSCVIMPNVKDEDKEATQALLRFAEFSGGGVWGGRVWGRVKSLLNI